MQHKDDFEFSKKTAIIIVLISLLLATFGDYIYQNLFG